MKTLIFDLDGTLIDPYDGIAASYRFALAKLGLGETPAHDFKACIGPPIQRVFRDLLGVAPELVGTAVSFYRERYGSGGLLEAELYPGVADAVSQLAPRTPLYICTSKPHLYAREILQHFGLAQFFEGIYGSEMDGTLSDKSALLEHLLKNERLVPNDDVVMIGDREHDMIAATRAGVRAVGVAWGYGSREELRTAGAGSIVDEPREFLTLAR